MWPNGPSPQYVLLRVGPGVNLSELCVQTDCLEADPAGCLETTTGGGGLSGETGGTGDDEAALACPGCLDNTTSDPLHDWAASWKAADWPYFTPEYMELVNKHWLAFPPPTSRQHLLILAIYTIQMVVGLSGNAIVVFMIARCRSLRTPSNLLVMNLAVSDFFMMSKTPITIYNSIKEGPALGQIGCTLYGFLGGVTGCGSIMTLAAIALDRYYVIANPLNRDFHTTRIRAIIWIILIWLYALFFSSIPIAGVGVKTYIPEGFLTTCSFDYLDDERSTKIFILSFFTAAWIVPFIIICLSYVGICRAVLVVSMATRMGQEKEKRKKEVKLAIVVILVVAMWFLSWTPYATVALLGIFGRKDLITPGLSMVPAVFCKTASCIDPFVYSLNHPRLRKEMFRIFCPKKYEMSRMETQKSLWNLKESRSSLNLKESKVRPNQAEEVDLEDVGEPWKKHKGTLSQAAKSRSESVRSEVIKM